MHNPREEFKSTLWSRARICTLSLPMDSYYGDSRVDSVNLRASAEFKHTLFSHSHRCEQIAKEDSYPASYTDFFGLPSSPICIYKTGPLWDTSLYSGCPEPRRCIRELRPVYGHPIAPHWEQIGEEIYLFLDSRSVEWTSIDPVAFANIGDENPFCPLLIFIGVLPQTLRLVDAVNTATSVKRILCLAAFPNIEVAFRESEVVRLATDDLTSTSPSSATKPFTQFLGLPLAPLKKPYHEGTGGLYLCVGEKGTNSESDEVQRVQLAILTASHVVDIGDRPSTEDEPVQVIALGEKQYKKATTYLEDLINLPNPTRTESDVCQWMEALSIAKKKSRPVDRVIGRAIHDSGVGVDESTGHMRDWALIEVDSGAIDWQMFPGNQVYLGSLPTFDKCPRGAGIHNSPENSADSKATTIQVTGIVDFEEIRNSGSPLEDRPGNSKALSVVKNGISSETTVGYFNGLKSFTRSRKLAQGNDIMLTSLDVAIIGYGNIMFSERGDSGAVVLDHTGRLVALLHSGGGAQGGEYSL